MGAIPETVLERLKAVVGPKGAIADPAEMAPYLTEWRDLYHFESPLVLRPATTEEVAAIVGICQETKTGLVPQGGNTGLCGGAVPGRPSAEVVVSLARMNRVRAVDRLNDTITVEAGCVLENVQRAADDADRFFPLRIGSQGSCQIGGNLSTNAGGTAVLRYGNARDLVLGLEVVLADGRVWDGLRGLRKDNSGYDLKHLFIGAEGTLGIITAAVLKLFPKPGATETALAGVSGVEAAVRLLAIARRASGDRVSAFEIMPRIGLELVLRHIPGTTDPLAAPHPWYVLIELNAGADESLRPTLEAILANGHEAGLLADATIAESLTQASDFWRLRDSLSEAQKLEGASIKHDISVPITQMAAFIERADRAMASLIDGARPIAFGHIGDGNIHYNPMQPVGADGAAFLERWQEINRVVYDIAAALGGSFSAEHGIGQLKRDDLARYKSDVELDMMRALKRALDPAGILNPGKVVEVT